jgi:hypothetical protein
MTNLTFVKGNRDREDLDPVSAAILEVASTGTSIFDPVVCEIAYRSFCPPGGAVLDPFAGGSVRGIVASKLGRPYTGIDLRAEQIDTARRPSRSATNRCRGGFAATAAIIKNHQLSWWYAGLERKSLSPQAPPQNLRRFRALRLAN